MAFDRSAVLRQAEKLAGLGRLQPAIAEYTRVLDDQPQDWKTANTLGDLCVRAGFVEQAIQHFMRIADHFYREGFFLKAGALYRKILKHQPTHEHALIQSADIAARAGLLADARTQLNAVVRLRRDRRDASGVSRIMIRLAALDPDDVVARRAGAQARVELGEPQEALRELKALAAHLLGNERHESAIPVLQDALAIDPNDLQVRADLRRELVLSGDGQSAVAEPRTAVEASAPATLLEESPALPAPAVVTTAVAAVPVIATPPAPVAPSVASTLAPPSRAIAATPAPADRAVASIPPSGSSILSPDRQDDMPVVIPPRVASPDERYRSKTAEIDLTIVLEDIRRAVAAPLVVPPAPPPLSANIEEVFAQLREEAGRGSAVDAADQDFTRGMLLLRSGDADGAVLFLEKAVRLPRFRFEAASALARVCRARQEVAASIEWMERAAEAPPTTPEAGHALLFDLAEALEAVGEGTRALAIYLELQADAGDFRDVSARVNRLLTVQAE